MSLLKRLAALLCALLVLCIPAVSRAADDPPEIAFSSVSAGYLHTAVVKEDGSLWTVGYNSCGQLGAGLPSDSDSPVDSLKPVRVMEDARAVYAGYWTTFAIDSSGTLYGWGSNANYLLGQGDEEDHASPVKILEGVVFAAPGQFHTAAVAADGTLFTWGSNTAGQLGTGSASDVSLPTAVLRGVRSASAGMQHTMAVKNDDTLWAAGDNSYGQLADGGTESSLSFRQVMDRVRSVTCTAFGTLILKTDGTLWACGYNAPGDLGTGDTENVPEPVMILENVSAVYTGKPTDSSGGCSAALAKDHTLYAWGNNSYGQLGSGMSFSPVPIAEDVEAASLGGGHLLMLLEDGTVLAQGNNEKGQLGAGYTGEKSSALVAAEGAAVPPKPVSRLPEILTAVGIALAVLLLFTFLIVRTLRGGRKKTKKPKAARPKKEKAMSDRELIRFARSLEQDRRAREQNSEQKPGE